MKIAEVGSRCTGTCFHPSHDPPLVIGGTVVKGSIGAAGDMFTGIARIGDPVKSDCGHDGTIVTGITSVGSVHQNVARVGDSVTGVYIAKIITGNSNVDG